MNEELLKRAIELLAQWNNSHGMEPGDHEWFVAVQKAGHQLPAWFVRTFDEYGKDDQE